MSAPCQALLVYGLILTDAQGHPTAGLSEPAAEMFAALDAMGSCMGNVHLLSAEHREVVARWGMQNWPLDTWLLPISLSIDGLTTRALGFKLDVSTLHQPDRVVHYLPFWQSLIRQLPADAGTNLFPLLAEQKPRVHLLLGHPTASRP